MDAYYRRVPDARRWQGNGESPAGCRRILRTYRRNSSWRVVESGSRPQVDTEDVSGGEWTRKSGLNGVAAVVVVGF